MQSVWVLCRCSHSPKRWRLIGDSKLPVGVDGWTDGWRHDEDRKSVSPFSLSLSLFISPLWDPSSVIHTQSFSLSLNVTQPPIKCFPQILPRCIICSHFHLLSFSHLLSSAEFSGRIRAWWDLLRLAFIPFLWMCGTPHTPHTDRSCSCFATSWLQIKNCCHGEKSHNHVCRFNCLYDGTAG